MIQFWVIFGSAKSKKTFQVQCFTIQIYYRAEDFNVTLTVPQTAEKVAIVDD